ncbi:hypothetical protein IQ31_04584 [Sphingobacterium siyangense]|uniref:Uncharacterized protein n=1 Tax=Sphingobacterium siyangense TaxID=459529 RepID=A0A562M9A5_9SPHI|nr:hypothetical protein IQ31_04584 [Sphingobacterium siyangense]
MKYIVLKCRQSDERVIADQLLSWMESARAQYEDNKVRPAKVWNSIKNVEYNSLTKHFQRKAATVAAIYIHCWEIVIFSKYLK